MGGERRDGAMGKGDSQGGKPEKIRKPVRDPAGGLRGLKPSL